MCSKGLSQSQVVEESRVAKSESQRPNRGRAEQVAVAVAIAASSAGSYSRAGVWRCGDCRGQAQPQPSCRLPHSVAGLPPSVCTLAEHPNVAPNAALSSCCPAAIPSDSSWIRVSPVSPRAPHSPQSCPNVHGRSSQHLSHS